MKFKVIGPAPFPVDMFRYNRCWPFGMDDSITIEKTLNGEVDYPPGLIHLETDDDRVTEERWASFGWTVIL